METIWKSPPQNSYEGFALLSYVKLNEGGHIRYAELDFIEILKQKVLAELKGIGIKISIFDKKSAKPLTNLWAKSWLSKRMK